MQNSIYKIKYLLFLSWDWEAWCLTQSVGVIPPHERNTALNKGRKCFHCLGASNNLIRPCVYVVFTSWLNRLLKTWVTVWYLSGRLDVGVGKSGDKAQIDHPSPLPTQFHFIPKRRLVWQLEVTMRGFDNKQLLRRM